MKGDCKQDASVEDGKKTVIKRGKAPREAELVCIRCAARKNGGCLLSSGVCLCKNVLANRAPKIIMQALRVASHIGRLIQ